jgi:hypothetical protein
LVLSADDLAKARAYFVEAEAARQKNQGSGTMKVALRAATPVLRMSSAANPSLATHACSWRR